MPIIHSECTILKVHGDFLDTRIKNTPGELSSYSEGLNLFLDRLFDEFGLIVCGWSATYDVALRDAITRSPNRRFSTFWLQHGAITSEAKDLVANRRVQLIGIDSADQILDQTLDRVLSLREMRTKHPVSTAVAAATVKRYLVNPASRIRLAELLREEAESVYAELTSDAIELNVSATKDLYLDRIQRYEAAIERLCAMLVAIGYYDAGRYSALVTNAIKRIAAARRQGSSTYFGDLQYYPALLSTYACGVAALAGQNWDGLAAVLLGPTVPGMPARSPAALLAKTNTASVFVADAIRMVETGEIPNISNYICQGPIRRWIREYVPGSREYEELFDTFELILWLTYEDLGYAKGEQFSKHFGRFLWVYGDKDMGAWAVLPGHDGPSFIRAPYMGAAWDNSPPAIFVTSSQADKLLGVGFFGGSRERLAAVYQQYKAKIESVCR